MSRKITGTVVSNKMDKTVVVTVERTKNHPIYKKQYKVTTRFHAHDAENVCQVGDQVELTETRPMSAKKHFEVSQILKSAGGAKK